jgi:hypothetical protein
MTVTELIAHLQTLPQDAEIHCLEEKQAYWDTWCTWKNLTLNDLSVIDLRGNQFVKPDSPNYNKIFLEIGSK